LEDLMAFNNEELVKAIYDSRIPIISGVGHEVDVTLCDLAADLRAATPTQAAQFAVPEYSLLTKEIAGLSNRLGRCMGRELTTRAERLDQSMMRKIWREPGAWLSKKDEQIAAQIARLHRAMGDILLNRNHQLALAAAALDNLSPLKVMRRGYAIFTWGDKIIRSVDEVNVGDELQADLADGKLHLTLKSKGRVDRWAN
jgi:exodeoxyribonuclease VII large subunit